MDRGWDRTVSESAPLPLSGWLILDKPRGMGSTQGVSAVKRVLRQNGYAKTKVGHGGTLDPLAEGVLPIAMFSCFLMAITKIVMCTILIAML